MPTICIPRVTTQVNLSHDSPQASHQMIFMEEKPTRETIPQCLQPRESLSHGTHPVFSQISSVLTALLTSMHLTSWHLNQVSKSLGFVSRHL